MQPNLRKRALALPLLRQRVPRGPLARRLHVNLSTLDRWRKQAGIPPLRAGPRITVRPTVTRDAILALLAAGLSYDQAARKLRMNPSTLHARVRLFPERASITGHACDICRHPARTWHHAQYLPEIIIPLCRACHARIHTLKQPPPELACYLPHPPD